MKPKVVLYHRLAESLVAELETHFDLKVFPGVDDENREAFLEAIQDADGLIGMGLPVSSDKLSSAKNLKVITTISAGYDAFDVDALTRQKIVLMNLFDPLTETTADLAFALLMATARRLVELDKRVRKGEWGQPFGGTWFGLDVHGKTLGIVGLGRIGSAIARRGALGCNMKVLYTARSPKTQAEEMFGAKRCELDELLRESDYVCVAVPLSAETTHLIGARELTLMKPTGILVNIARGAVIDEAALIHALQTGIIHAAGLDVFEEEPLPISSPLIDLENVVLAPHIGSATAETRHNMAAYAVETLVGYLIHGKSRNVVNPLALA